MALTLILNEVLRPDLRAALEEDARSEGISLNDLATRILATHYALPVQLSGTPYRATADQFKLRVPADLHMRIRVEAAAKLVTVRGIVLSILAEKYALDPISPNRRPRKEKAA